MYSLEDTLNNLYTASRMLQGLRNSPDVDDQDEARYAEIIDLCADIRQSAESVAALAQQHSRELRKTSRTEREMIGFIVNAIEEKPVKNRPSTNDVEAGGVKARVIRLADGKCELCGIHHVFDLPSHRTARRRRHERRRKLHRALPILP